MGILQATGKVLEQTTVPFCIADMRGLTQREALLQDEQSCS